MAFFYSFPAVRGTQASREYYVTMIPLKFLCKLFPPGEEVVPPEYRAQRRINEQRIPEIRDYILDNRDNYVFSALSASIDGQFEFIPFDGQNIGTINIDMDAVFLINDGQHRKAAIEAALAVDPSLGTETISIVLFSDSGLSRSQQMFTDLNKHAVKTSNSLSTLYDARDQIAVATKAVIETVPFLRKYTDKERDILGKNSSSLFTLNTVYKANQKILHGSDCSDADQTFLIRFWNGVADNIIEWIEVQNKLLTKKDLRENYIVTLSVTLIALGRLGRMFYDQGNLDMEEYLKKLRGIDWLRSNSDWKKRAIGENGKVQNSDEAAILICAQIKKYLGLELTKEEKQKEAQLKGNKR